MASEHANTNRLGCSANLPHGNAITTAATTQAPLLATICAAPEQPAILSSEAARQRIRFASQWELVEKNLVAYGRERSRS